MPQLDKPNGALDTLFIRGRHMQISTWVSSQKLRLISAAVRVNQQFLCCWRLRNQHELEAVIEELSALLPKDKLRRIYEQATRDPYSFLFVYYLKPKNEMFHLRFEERNNDPSRTWVISYSKEWRSPGWRRKGPSLHVDPSRTLVISYSKEWRSPGWRRKGPSLHVDPSRTRTYFLFSGEALTRLEAERSVSTMIRLGPGHIFLFSGEALTRLEAERSVSPH